MYSKDFAIRMKFIFTLYDFDSDGLISKADVKALLNHVPANYYK